MPEPSRDQIEQVIDELVRPVLHADGGDLKVVRITPNGTVSVVFMCMVSSLDRQCASGHHPCFGRSVD